MDLCNSWNIRAIRIPLILVLVEDGLWLWMARNSDWIMMVLILVLVEDGLWHRLAVLGMPKEEMS